MTLMTVTRFSTGQRTDSLLAGGVGWAQQSDFEKIADIVVGSGGAASVTFSSIPSDYKHLQIRYVARSTEAQTVSGAPGMRLNGVTTSTYASHGLLGDGSTASSSAYAGYDYMYFFRVAGANATSGIFGVGIVDILDYASSAKNKTIRYLNGTDTNNAGSVAFSSGVALSTSPVTSVTFDPRSSSLWAQYTSFSLYGIK